MKHKVADLEGALLDMAVAKALGAKGLEIRNDLGDGEDWCYAHEPPPEENWSWGLWSHYFAPSTDWEMGGPLIEQERLHCIPAHGTTGPSGWASFPDHLSTDYAQYGPTPLIASMRAYVASKFGDEVELP